MSGHSKWAKIKRQKGANDAKKGALFTKLAKAITLAAQEGGGDPTMNFSLRLAIDKAKRANMPMGNIERAVKRSSGSVDEKITQVNYEGIGPAGSVFIVVCSSDNTNRTVAEIRKIFENSSGTLAAVGSTIWQFEENGVVTIKPEILEKTEKFGKEDQYMPVEVEELELKLIDIDGIKEISNVEGEIEIITAKTDLSRVHKQLDQMGLHIVQAEIQFLAKEPLELTSENQEKVIKLLERLDDHPDVENVFTNVAIS